MPRFNSQELADMALFVATPSETEMVTFDALDSSQNRCQLTEETDDTITDFLHRAEDNGTNTIEENVRKRTPGRQPKKKRGRPAKTTPIIPTSSSGAPLISSPTLAVSRPKAVPGMSN